MNKLPDLDYIEWFGLLGWLPGRPAGRGGERFVAERNLRNRMRHLTELAGTVADEDKELTPAVSEIEPRFTSGDGYGYCRRHAENRGDGVGIGPLARA